ncbi:PLP-dependent aminotransferase family protein [Variovorax humicola]|uniref:PLP-dependent aminotransferase family protein n=1 Tax=Variovorax humicola TaxID=1769758 RepID=A0ABU8VWB6_9BURK
MELHVVIEGRKDLTGQLYGQLKDAIRSGRLAGGEQLPPTRLLAEQLGLSRKTVAEAYARLTYDQLLVGRTGIGTFVSKGMATRPAPQRTEDLAGAAVAAQWGRMATPLRHAIQDAQARFEYIGGAPSAALFPAEDWRRCMSHAMRESAKSRGFYGPAEGLPALRQAIARHIAFSRGVQCAADDVIVTAGAQQALDLVARVLVSPGSVVAIEEPGYPPMRYLLEAQGARVVGVPVDDEGIVVDAIPAGTRFIYVTPAHQFPLGMPVSQARRIALLRRAQELGAVVVEDDFDSEFRYTGRPTETLFSLDTRGTVAYVGTFSKTMSPQLRLGYLVAPPSIRDAVATAKHLTDSHTPPMQQWALARFIDDGLLVKHIRRCHAAYALRREKLIARFAGDLAPWFEVVVPAAGFHMAALCRQPVDIGLLISLARRVDVGLYPLAPFFHFTPPQEGLLMGFGAIDSLDIDPSLDRVRDILTQIA